MQSGFIQNGSHAQLHYGTILYFNYPVKFLTLFSSSRPFNNFSFKSCGVHCIGMPKSPQNKGFQPAERLMLSHQYGGPPYIAIIVRISTPHWHLGSLSPVSWRKVTNDWTEQCAITDHVVLIIIFLWRKMFKFKLANDSFFNLNHWNKM